MTKFKHNRIILRKRAVLFAPGANVDKARGFIYNFHMTADRFSPEAKSMLSSRKAFVFAALLMLTALVFVSCGNDAPSPEGDSSSYFEAHFLDVGEGDAALILCDGHAMLIDGAGRDLSHLCRGISRDGTAGQSS